MSNRWCDYRPIVTVVDVLETGACFDGIREWIAAHRGVIAGPTESHAKNEWIAKAAHSSGSGSGSGYGDGYGSGSGYGYGYGYGYGSGDGDGYGDGYGYGELD